MDIATLTSLVKQVNELVEKELKSNELPVAVDVELRNIGGSLKDVLETLRLMEVILANSDIDWQYLLRDRR